MSKRLLSLLLALMLCVGLLPLGALAAAEEEEVITSVEEEEILDEAAAEETSEETPEVTDEEETDEAPVEEDALPMDGETVSADYLDVSGETKTATGVTVLTAGGEYPAGWYILRGTEPVEGRIIFTGSANLIVADGAAVTVKGGIGLDGAEISLTIYAQSGGSSMGALTVSDVQNNYAGIGSRWQGSCGDITINGGSVTVKGGAFGAGIGAGYAGSNPNSKCGLVTINGGTVKATGGYRGAGIGGGFESSCGGITINGGIVEAQGGDEAAGIGSGRSSGCGAILLSGGSVAVTGGTDGAGIGSGNSGKCDGITVTGGGIKVKAGAYAEYVGSGYDGTCGAVTLVPPCQSKTIDGFCYINFEPVEGAASASCNISGYLPYFKDVVNERYYTAFPFTASSLIGDEAALAAWKAAGGAGYIAPPLAHCDDDGDTLCDRCETKYYETVDALQPTCTEAGYSSCFKLLADGKYYSAVSFAEDDRIGDEAALAAWRAAGGDGYVAPLGHCDENGDGICDRCGPIPYYDYDAASGQMVEKQIAPEDLTVINSASGAQTLTEGWYILAGTFEPGQLTCKGAVHLILGVGANVTVKGGIYLDGAETSLTVYTQSGGTEGALIVTDVQNNYAGIGSRWQGSCGDITINGGSVTVKGGAFGAGIGAGYADKNPNSKCGLVTINGGTVKATGGYRGAGIGSGYESSCGGVVINGGTVTVTGGSEAAGIGSGNRGSCGAVTVNGGIVTAEGGALGAGIGSGWHGKCDDITVNDGYLKAKSGGGDAQHIGHGDDGSCGTVRYDESRAVEKDGWLYVNYLPVSAVRPTLTKAGHPAYVKDLKTGLYYRSFPFSDNLLIGDDDDLARWLDRGGAGYINPLRDDEPTTPQSPKTGDTSHAALWLSLSLVSVMGAAAVLKKKKA